jgi:NAD(P)-dependent dehydrogenase (short-subunit alcohol dehydrogenase family)
MKSMFDLGGKCAVVTGAASGIGKAVAQRFKRAGARVALVDRRDASALARKLDGIFVGADVSSEAELEHALESARAHFGRLDILVNNAGIQPLGVSVADLSEALLDRTIAINLKSVAFGIKLAERFMENGGRVINTSSFVGLIGTPGSSIYGMTKAAVVHLTKTGAIELAPRRITVNAVCPGTIRTPAVTGLPDNPEIPFVEQQTPLGRLGEPDEVAALFHFLASDEAAYITGQAIAIDGGITAGWNRYELVAPPNVFNGSWCDDPEEISA